MLSVYSGLSSDGKYLKLGLHAHNHTRGWSAVGFSGNGGMKGASQIVVRLDESGQWVAEDRYSLDYVMPTLDPEQDVQLIFAHDNGVNISWGVLLPQESCDPNDYPADNIPHVYIWALGATHTFEQHVDRGQFHANLVSGIVPFAPLNNVTLVDIKMPNVPVVSATADSQNPYICGIFDLRQLVPDRNFSGKVHVAKFSPYLAPGTASYIHHMILYGCDPTATTGFVHGSVIPSCQSMPGTCNVFKWVWAVGSPDVQLPDDVGMPFGEGAYWVALQMHYYNPQLENVSDTSGVTLALPLTNRPTDAGILPLNGGVTPKQRANLTANTPRFTLNPPLIAPSSCTSSWETPITIAGAVHHMHLVGMHQQIEIARNGTNLGVLRRERIWDFKHQSLEAPLISQMLPGDEIRVVCEYDTTGKMVGTSFGENTDNEMCWAALLHYPAQAGGFVYRAAPSMAANNATAQLCLTQSVNFPNTSQCAEAYFNDPMQVLLGTSGGKNASIVCNVIPILNSTQFATLAASNPSGRPVCPPCYLDANCTVDELVAFGQTDVCPTLCGQYQVSVFPDVSRPFNPANIQATSCGPLRTQTMIFDPKQFPALPACVANGNINNTAEFKPLVAAVLVSQAACPNAAIKNMFANCAPADLDLTVNNKANNCREPCRNATADLVAAFTEMVPLPSAAQMVQCVTDYNTAWLPFNVDGALWPAGNMKLAVVLQTRLQQGAPLCDVPVINYMNSASQHPALFALVICGFSLVHLAS